jgi:hypothetical protein
LIAPCRSLGVVQPQGGCALRRTSHRQIAGRIARTLAALCLIECRRHAGGAAAFLGLKRDETGMETVRLDEVDREVIQKLNMLPESTERARHKVRMIRIVERAAAKMNPPANAAAQIEAAAEWLSANGVE